MLRETYNCYVYHIHLEGQSTSEGYIGVSKNPSSRYEHHRNRSENPHLRNAINLYKSSLIYDIIFQGEEESCYELEKHLRPEKNIGWNINVGGSKPPSPKGTTNCISNISPDKRRKNYKHSDLVRTKLKKILGSDEVRKKISESKMGEKNPQYRMRGKLNPNFQGFYITGDGIFESQYCVAGYYGISRNAVSRRFISCNAIKPNRWQPKEFWGKTWQELGWKFIGETNMTYEKLCYIAGWKLPRIYSFVDYDDLKFLVENLGNLQEGVVLYKEGTPTLKLKNSLYLICHRLRGEGLNPKRIMQLVLMKEVDEYLAIFPEDVEHFDKYIIANSNLETQITDVWENSKSVSDQKEFALMVKDYPFSGVLFQAKKLGEDNPLHLFHKMPESFKLKVLTNYV